jgi:O-antigen/teichoic acid export membrane protein
MNPTILLLFSNGSVVFFNYFFHALASRVLGPGDYGTLVSMLTFLTILAIPAQSIQIAIAQNVAEIAARGTAPPHFRKFFEMGLAGIGGIGFVLIYLGAGPLSTFFHLPTPAPIIAVGGTTLIMFGLAVARGWLQGLGKYAGLGINYFSDGLLRLLLGVLFFYGWQGRVIAGILTSGLAGGAAFLLAEAMLPRERGAYSLRAWFAELIAVGKLALPAGMTVLSFIALASVDIMLVKHFFEPEKAGYYSAASMVGKVFLVVGMATAQVLLPQASNAYACSQPSAALLWKSLLSTAALLLFGSSLAWWLAPHLIVFLFGSRFLDPEAVQLVSRFGLALTPLALVYIFSQYHLAMHHRRLLWLLTCDLLVLVGLLNYLHRSLMEVLTLVGFNHLFLLLGAIVLTLFKKDAGPCPSTAS